VYNKLLLTYLLSLRILPAVRSYSEPAGRRPEPNRNRLDVARSRATTAASDEKMPANLAALRQR